MTLLAGGRRRGEVVPSDPWADPTVIPTQGVLPAPGYTIPTATPYNVGSGGVCTTPTPDGTGSGVHPDVIDFGTPWQGFRFWMAFTPYYNNTLAEENPCVLASHDGLTWTPPPGLTNPIYPAPDVRWNSDTDLAYDPSADQLVLMYREGEKFVPCVARSSDGVTWLPATPQKVSWTPLAQENLSPSILRLPSGLWVMWGIGVTDRKVYRWTAPSPEGPWASPTQCTGAFSPQLWHHNVVRLGTTLYMLAHVGREPATGGSTAYTATSTDGLAWTVSATPILTPNTGWDGGELYRGALQPHENGTHMRVWYCGRPVPVPKNWRIGLTEVPLTEWPTP